MILLKGESFLGGSKILSNNIININKINKTKCPICKKAVVRLYTPFCSKKCSNIDLMKWLTDEKEYSISNEYRFTSQ
jgi:endogenous inhibitor of DNA gyrase (YacG/DUF329 family)